MQAQLLKTARNLSPSKRIQTLLYHDLLKLTNKQRATILLDYIDTDPIAFEKHICHSSIDSIQLLSIDVEDITLNYLINTECLLHKLNTNVDTQLNIIDVGPMLEHPILIDDSRSKQIEGFVRKNVCEHLASTISSSDSFHIHATITKPADIVIIDTSLINGYLLEYPYIYVRLGMMLGTGPNNSTEDNCLSEEPLNVITVSNKENKDPPITQFTIPVCILNEVKSVTSEYEQKGYRVETNIVRHRNLLL